MEFLLWPSEFRTDVVSVRMQALFSALRIQCCHKLWRRSQMWLGSGVGVVVAVVYTSAAAPIGPLAWEIPYAAQINK